MLSHQEEDGAAAKPVEEGEDVLALWRLHLHHSANVFGPAQRLRSTVQCRVVLQP